ncbi:MAG: 23S rRNA (guanosine(2251)-2'-O)-methyltransferase RlmB [Vulcanococcus sp.]
MSPRFDRRRDQGQGSGAAGGRPFRGPKPFKARGEWRPDGPEREGRAERPQRRFGADRPDGPRGPRFEGARADAPRGDRFRPAGGRPERRFEGRSEGGRPEGRGGAEGRRPEARRSEGRRPFSSSAAEGRPPFRAGRPLGRPQLGEGRGPSRRPERDGARSYGRDARPFNREDRGGLRGPGRSDSRPIAVEVPVGEAERFQAGPADDLVWGRHAAQAALESDRPIHRIWCTPELRFQPRFLQLLREAKAGGVLVEEVTWARLGQLTDGAVHQGIVLQVAAADTLDLSTLIDGCRGLGEPPLLMALDGITDPHNLGAIVRSAEALGAHGLVLPQRRSAGLTGSVAKVAAGALEHLPVARVVNLNRSLETLKEEGYRVIGLAGEGSVPLGEADLDGPLVIVTGSEGSGLSMLTRKHCDQLVRIPLRGATPSLNASVATAMVLYEIARRGWMKQISGSAPAPRIVRPQLPAPALQPSEPDGAADLSSAAEDAVQPGPAAVSPAPLSPEADLPEPAPAAGGSLNGGVPQAQPAALEPTEASAEPVVDLSLGLPADPLAGFSGDIQL